MIIHSVEWLYCSLQVRYFSRISRSVCLPALAFLGGIHHRLHDASFSHIGLRLPRPRRRCHLPRPNLSRRQDRLRPCKFQSHLHHPDRSELLRDPLRPSDIGAFLDVEQPLRLYRLWELLLRTLLPLDSYRCFLIRCLRPYLEVLMVPN